MAYPFPREMKERVRSLPGASVLESLLPRDRIARVLHLPVAAVAAAPVDRPVRFVVVGQGRSGSTLLVDLLDSHPNIYCDEELLHYRLRFPSAYVDGKSLLTRRPVFGYKVKPSHIVEDQGLDPVRFLQEQTEAGWRVIHLSRSSVARQTLSGLVARQRSSYHSVEDSSAKAAVLIPPAIFCDRLEGRLRYRVLEEEMLATVESLEIEYERDLIDAEAQQRTADTVFDWLGLDRAPVATRLRTVRRKDWRADVLNADEVVAEAERRGLGHHLEADGLV